MEKDNQEKLKKIKSQVEYYLSDENLAKDKFFHELISKDIEGYFDISILLSCNNLKKISSTTEEIQEALSSSSLLELNSDKTQVRRKNNKPLPELKLLQNKRKKEIKDEKEQDSDKDEEMDNLILKIVAVKGETDIKWQKIHDNYKKDNPNLNVVYMRFNKNEGNIGVTQSSNKEVEFRTDLRIENVDFKVSKCEGEDLITFWKDHGSHFEHCLSKKTRNNKNKKKQNKFELRNPVELGGEIYSDLTLIKARCRKILSMTKDGEIVSGKDNDFIRDLLKFHKKADEKLKDVKHLTTGQPLQATYSRSFYIVRNDDSKEDISAFKCIEWLQNTQNKRN